jgi:GTP-binding protein HflX
LSRLADTAGLDVVGTVTQRLERPDPKTFIGSGKAAEAHELATELEAMTVVVDDELSPSQQANLEALLAGVRVIDRTQLILDIFARHAVSHEGKLQVELARLEYLLPRLRGMWATSKPSVLAAAAERVSALASLSLRLTGGSRVGESRT